MIEQEWFYLARHPHTDLVHVARETLLWDGEEWHLPDYRTSLPHAIADLPWYGTESEAYDALARYGAQDEPT